jgi:hypothetical protein
MPNPALQFKPSVPPPFRPLSQEPVAGQFQAKAETPTQLKRDTLAALANELSTRAPAPPKGLAKVARPQLVEPHPELRFEPSVNLRSESGTEPRSESDPEPRPEYFVETQAEPPMEAPQSAPSPPPPVRARPASEPQLQRADAEITTPGDSLEQQLASLLGRAIKN